MALAGLAFAEIANADTFGGETPLLVPSYSELPLAVKPGPLFFDIAPLVVEVPAPIVSFQFPGLPLGLLLGLISCGFLYAVLINAALTADPAEGALVMLGFAVGTAPSLLAFGGLAHLLGARVRGWMLRGAGILVALMGVYNLYRHLVFGPGCH